MNNLKSKIVILGILAAMLSCLLLLSGCGEATLSEIYVGKDGMPKKVTYVVGQELDLTGCHLPPLGKACFVRPESSSAFPDRHCFCGHKSEAPPKRGK